MMGENGFQLVVAFFRMGGVGSKSNIPYVAYATAPRRIIRGDIAGLYTANVPPSSLPTSDGTPSCREQRCVSMRVAFRPSFLV